MTVFCPAGDGEFEDWVEVCPDCGRKLVSDPPLPGDPLPARNDQPVVLLTKIANEPLAQMTREVLAGEGIKVMLKPGGPGFGGWGSAANLEHELYVLQSQADAAREILADFEASDGDLDESDPEGSENGLANSTADDPYPRTR